MKDDETIENEFLGKNFDFYSNDINDTILSIFSFLKKLGLKSDFPVFCRERLKEEKGEDHLRKIERRRERRRLKATEEFIKIFVLKTEKVKHFNIVHFS